MASATVPAVGSPPAAVVDVAATAAGSGAMVSSMMAGATSVASDTPAMLVEPHDEASYVFDDTQLRTYNILVDPADLAQIDAMPAAEMLVPAQLEFEGKIYGPYKVRYKGAQGSFLYPCTGNSGSRAKLGKCSIKLDFNDTDANARFFGLKKLNLHSMNADASMLRDRLGYQMFREMGVAAPRAVHARVLINGKLEGLFAAVEQIDGRFTRARFTDGGDGNLYKEVWPMHAASAAYVSALESNRSTANVQAMLDFKQAVDSSPTATEAFFDHDYLMRYLAVDRVIINDDGVTHFWCNDLTGQGNNPGVYGNHNYYWYQERAANRFWLIPWDLDHSFDNSAAVHLDIPWTQQAPCACENQSVAGMNRATACDGLFSDCITWLPSYETKVDEFLAGPFQKAHVDALLDGWSAQIRGAVREAAGVKLAPDETAWMDGVDKLLQKIDSARTHRGYAY